MQWFSEVSKLSSEPWLLIIDNCGGHDVGLSLRGVRIEFLTPRTTAVIRPLDVGIIAATKIKARHLFLQKIIQDMLLRRSDGHNFKN